MTSTKSAPGAAFGGSSLLALLLCLISFPAFSDVFGCGSLQAVSGRYIVRATAVSSQGARAENLSVLQRLVRAAPSKLIHIGTASLERDSAQRPQSFPQLKDSLAGASADSIMTVATELSDDELRDVTNDPTTLSIEQDCIVHVESLPNDPVPSNALFPRASLNLASAWDLRTSTDDVIVAVSDTGVDYTHEDLAANIWTNQVELNGLAQVDDDGNGCIDDIHGCDFGDYDGDPKPFNSSEGDHGTHVAGIIGAVGNNSLGVNGVAWSTHLMAVKGFDSVGNARVSDLLNTIYYAVNNGARVINCSWGASRAATQSEIDAFQFALSKNVLPVVAAGNSSQDAAQFSPAAINGVLSVGSVNSDDRVSGFSNYGASVLVYAPGGDAISAGGTKDEFIYSTLPSSHGSYGMMRGTSMAAPFVSGLAALVFAVNPLLSANDVRSIIVASSRHAASVLPNGVVSTIAIPDAHAALLMAATYVPTIASAPSSPSKPTSVSSKPVAPAIASDSSSGCALKQSATPTFPSVIFLIVPLMAALALRRRVIS